jgi:hypothetical protein
MAKGKRGFDKGNRLGGNKPQLLKTKGREFILQCINGDEGLRKIIQSAFAKAVKGSVRHQELLLNYILGKPVEKIKLEGWLEQSGTAQAQPLIQIVADHLRLQQLEKDYKAVKEVPQERIEEMEKVLNEAVDKKKLK